MTNVIENPSNPIIGKKDRPERAELTDQEARLRELFRLSFMVSQGSTIAQLNIFKWLKLKGHLDEFEIDANAPQFILDIKPPKKHPTKNPDGSKLSSNSNKETLKREWGWLRRAKISTISYMTKPTNPIPIILDCMLDSEIQFQNEGRPHKPPDKKYDSLVRNRLILDQPIEHDVYQQLLDEAKPHLFTLRHRNQRLTNLESLWEQKHDRESFFPERAAA